MKEYILWLDKGEAIYGTITSAEAERLKKAFRDQRPEVCEIQDTDGSTLVNLRQVAALAINDVPDHNRKVGF